MDTFVIELSGTLNAAASLFLASAGLTLIFGAMRVINLAHGSFYMYGAFLVTSLVGFSTGTRFWWSIPLAAVGVAAIGAATEYGLIRHVYGKEHLTQLLVTYALFLIFADLGQRIWGTQSRSVLVPLSFLGSATIGGAQVPKYDAIVVGSALTVGLALWLLLKRTPLGWRIRAAVDDPELIEAGGVDLQWLFTIVFTIGAFLAGLGGAVIAPQIAVTPGIDGSIIVGAFLVTVIGGLGSVGGAAIGAVLIGASQTAGTLIVPSWSSAFPYLAMIAVLAVRPTGLFGTADR
jgi:branched-subunit amino acid ABC-type transport system permease component